MHQYSEWENATQPPRSLPAGFAKTGGFAEEAGAVQQLPKDSRGQTMKGCCLLMISRPFSARKIAAKDQAEQQAAGMLDVDGNGKMRPPVEQTAKVNPFVQFCLFLHPGGVEPVQWASLRHASCCHISVVC